MSDLHNLEDVFRVESMAWHVRTWFSWRGMYGTALAQHAILYRQIHDLDDLLHRADCDLPDVRSVPWKLLP